jgi:glycosyltransferase involved in cell wall biosynthesis
LVQWVPHAFGWRSLNLPFCIWLWLRKVIHQDRVEIMVHEPFLAWAGSWAQRLAALVHRVMTILLLQSAGRVWLSTSSWEPLWRPYALGRKVPFCSLPVPANIPVVADSVRVNEVRARLAPRGFLLGHFGTYSRLVVDLLDPVVVQLLRDVASLSVVLIGRGGETYRQALAKRHPDLAERVVATGALRDAALSFHLQACDLLLQPYPDGVSTRRGSLMAALAHGRPVVSTSGLLTEPFWADCNSVALAPVTIPSRLSELTVRLVGDATERNRLAEAGLHLYRERFALEHTVAALRQND